MLPGVSRRPTAATELSDLVALVRRLRRPDGCPWDRERRLPDIRAYLLEEAHELATAIDDAAWPAVREELGDLLFQCAFVATLASEAGAFDARDAVRSVHEKMVDRHPHVFGDEPAADAEAVHEAWERRKVGGEGKPLLLEGVPRSLPALVAALRLTEKAAGVGFDWNSVEEVLTKVREEVAEIDDALAASDAEATKEEIGDLLFAVANLARHAGVDPEAALAATNEKFRRRLGSIERTLRSDGRRLGDADLVELEKLWVSAKEADSEHDG